MQKEGNKRAGCEGTHPFCGPPQRGLHLGAGFPQLESSVNGLYGFCPFYMTCVRVCSVASVVSDSL